MENGRNLHGQPQTVGIRRENTLAGQRRHPIKSGDVSPVIVDELPTWLLMKLGAVPEWFQKCQTWSFDELRLLDVRLVDFRFLQRGGSRAKTTSGLLPLSLKHTVLT